MYCNVLYKSFVRSQAFRVGPMLSHYRILIKTRHQGIREVQMKAMKLVTALPISRIRNGWEFWISLFRSLEG